MVAGGVEVTVWRRRRSEEGRLQLWRPGTLSWFGGKLSALRVKAGGLQADYRDLRERRTESRRELQCLRFFHRPITDEDICSRSSDGIQF